MRERIETYRRKRAAGETPAAALVAAKAVHVFPASQMFSKHRRAPGAPLFFESAEDTGLRFVNYADKLTHIGHEGWYTFPDGDPDDTLRGVVFRLPRGRGFVAGYQESCNGGFVIDPSEVLEPDCVRERDSAKRNIARQFWQPQYDNPEYWRVSALEQAAKDCACRADSMAKSAAEKERDYHAAWYAGQRYAEHGEGVKIMRREALDLLAERKQVTKILAERHGLGSDAAPALCAAIRARVDRLLTDIRRVRDERGELAGHDYTQAQRDAFNEGAGEVVFGPDYVF